jgi:thiamine biosynthesis protein ThiI
MFLLIKYGELVLKKGNRDNFINCLINNIKKGLKKFNEVKVIKFFDNCKIYGLNNSNKKNIIEILTRIPGINLIIPAFETDKKKLIDISNCICDEIKNVDFVTFKIETKRKNKNFEFGSLETSRIVGGELLKKLKNKRVDVHSPNIVINI